jgi:hypothetical protein
LCLISRAAAYGSPRSRGRHRRAECDRENGEIRKTVIARSVNDEAIQLRFWIASLALAMTALALSSSWPGFVPTIHVFPAIMKTWIPTTSAGMTKQ